jgi:hypothetical protein
MHGSALAVGRAGLALALFAPLRKAVRTAIKPNKARRALSTVHLGRKRVPIRVWQTHSWTKKIARRSFEPDLPRRVRILRFRT